MVTQSGAATTPFRGHIGGLAVGQAADIVVLDWDRVTYPWQDPKVGFTDVLLRRAKTQAVREVYVARQLIYSGGRFMLVDRKAELQRLAQWLHSPQTAFEQDLGQLSEATAPFIQRLYEFYSAELSIKEHLSDIASARKFGKAIKHFPLSSLFFEI